MPITEPVKRVEHSDCQGDLKLIASYADIGVGPAVVFDGAAFTDPESLKFWLEDLRAHYEWLVGATETYRSDLLK